MSPALLDPGSSRRQSLPGADDGSLPPTKALVRTLGAQVLLPTAIWLAVLVTVGWLLSRPLKDAVSFEDGVSRSFAAARTPFWNSATNAMSLMANTGTIIITTAVAAAVYWYLSRRLREVVTLWTGVAMQALVFLLTTLAVDRPRPGVPKLDESPPTSSFPSGHTGAASALYFGLVILCLTRLRSTPLRVAALVVFGLVPFLVATARLYRGMHHPSDVLFGMLNGLLSAVLAHRAMRVER